MNWELRSFLWVSRLEGLSYLLLLGIAMPLKYALDMPLMVKYVGWAHGVLFVGYCVMLAYVGLMHSWKFRTLIIGFVASLLPFGPFVFERKFLGKSK